MSLSLNLYDEFHKFLPKDNSSGGVMGIRGGFRNLLLWARLIPRKSRYSRLNGAMSRSKPWMWAKYLTAAMWQQMLECAILDDSSVAKRINVRSETRVGLMGESGQICTMSRPRDLWLQAVNSRPRSDLTTIFWQNFQARIPALISNRFSKVPFSLDQKFFCLSMKILLFFSVTPEIIPVISCRFECYGLLL